ncbi:MAG TPA: ornithine carbamoyltransferase [Gaiellales bacterium]|jgi:ornithine carbamoyltransferase|nr:ornithine carbamoyltransferase [Gaiellales bacterium]
MATTTRETPPAVAPADLLRISDLDARRLFVLLDLASEMKAAPHGWETSLRGDTVAMFFEKPSTRTRVSFAAACQHLGALPLGLRPDELQLGRGEPIADTARILSGYSSAIVVRTYAQAILEEMAAVAEAPVINALTDDHHPCQALADLMTLREQFGGLQGLRVAYLGDGNNVAHSLMEAGALAGMRVTVATPPGYEPDPAVVDRASELARRNAGAIAVIHEPLEAATRAHAVYTDVWVSMGEEAERERREQVLRSFQVTPELMRRADSSAVFLHCLPAHRGEEVAAEVIDGPQSLVWRQAENRLWTEEAVLYAYIRRAWEVR